MGAAIFECAVFCWSLNVMSISFKCECYIIMQIQYTKNLNPGRFELGTTLSWPIWSMGYKMYIFRFCHSSRTGVSAIDGLWHHICATWNNSDGSWKLYKDGMKEKDGEFKRGKHFSKFKNS